MKIILLLISSMLVFSCAKIDAMFDTPEKMDVIAGKTDELARKETVKTAVQELNDSKNYKKLSPIPTDIIPWAKKAAEYMNVDDELVPYIYIKLKDVTTLRYDDNNPGKVYDINDPAAIEFEMNKVGLFNALAATSGFLPEAKVDQLLARLANSAEYSSTVINILALRFYFIQNVLMAEKYKQDQLVDMGAIEAAITYNQSIERILKLPFANQIKTQVASFVLMTDFNDALTIELDPMAAKRNWNGILNGMTKYYKVGAFTAGNATYNNQQAARYQAALIRVQNAVKSYETVNP